MPLFQEVIAAAGGAALIIVILIGGVGFIFRQALAVWLTRRLGAGLEREAERYKHNLARDMEKYKDELHRVQSIDRFRTEARKAVAERLLDRRLEALHDVSLALNKVPSWILAGACTPRAGRAPSSELLVKMQELSGTFDKHSLYFDDQFGVDYRRLCTTLHRLAGNWLQEDIVREDDAQIVSIMQRTVALRQAIDQMHKRLPAELANNIAGAQPQQDTAAVPADNNRG